MKKLFIAILLVVSLFVSAAQAQISPAKRAEIQKLLRLMGMEKLMTQMKEQMITTFKAQQPGVSEDFWTRMSDKMDVRELLDQIIPIYDKYYTLDDLKNLNAFYESPTGQKVITTMPQVMQESSNVGLAWGQKVGREIDQAAQKEQKTTH